MMLKLLFLSLAVAAIDAQCDCTGLPDGPTCAGCESYTLCQGGVGIIVDCPGDSVYNVLVGRCDSVENTPPPCGKETSCAQLPDGRYPDMTEGQLCEYYFTCLDGQNLGFTPCNAPGTSGLVFRYTHQTCDWKYNVPPPCGTNAL